MPDDLQTYTFDEARSYALFTADAYEGGVAWDRPSASTLGAAQLYGYRVVDLSDGRQAVVEKTTDQVRSYLVPWPGETLTDFNRRRSLAFYVNLVEPIVDAYLDAIVPRATRELGAAGQYLANLDGDGKAWPAHVGDIALQAALDGVVAVLYDRPRSNPATNRAEEQALGIGLRACVVPLASWAWLKLDPEGCVREFAYVDAPTVVPGAVNQHVRVWVWNAKGWARYDRTIAAGAILGVTLANVSEGEPDDSGPLAPELKGKLPVVFGYHRRLPGRVPRGKSLGASPAAIGRQVYQLLSQVEDIQRRAPSFLSLPTKATNGLDAETKAKVGPANPLPAPEGAGAPSWVVHPTEPLADTRLHVAFLVGLAFRVSGLEVQADQSAQVQSGEALRVRSRDFEARAFKFATSLGEFESRAFDMAALLLGTPRAPMKVTYPQRYVIADTSELLAVALTVLDKLGTKLGPEGTMAAIKQALVAALSLDDAQVEKVLAEVRAKLEEPKPEPPTPPTQHVPPGAPGDAPPEVAAKAPAQHPPPDAAAQEE